MALGTGINVSKYGGSALLTLPTGINVSKYGGSTLMLLPTGVNVSKYGGSSLLVPVYLNPPVWDVALAFGNGVLGSPYSQTGSWTTGTPPVVYTLNSGTLPTGLSITNFGTNQGKLSGTPTTLGTYTFTLLATNTYGAVVSQSFSITISIPVGVGGSWTFVS